MNAIEWHAIFNDFGFLCERRQKKIKLYFRFYRKFERYLHFLNEDHSCNLCNRHCVVSLFCFLDDNNRSNYANRSVFHISFHSWKYVQMHNYPLHHGFGDTGQTKVFSSDWIGFDNQSSQFLFLGMNEISEINFAKYSHKTNLFSVENPLKLS